MSQPAQYSHSYFIYPRFSMFSSFPKKTKNKPPPEFCALYTKIW